MEQRRLPRLCHHGNGGLRLFKEGYSSCCGTAFLSQLLRNPVYAQADLELYEFFKSQGATIVNDASDFAGTNGCYLYQGRDVKEDKDRCLKDQILLIPKRPSRPFPAPRASHAARRISGTRFSALGYRHDPPVLWSTHGNRFLRPGPGEAADIWIL